MSETFYKCQRPGCDFVTQDESEANAHRGTDDAPGHGEVGTFVVGA